MCCDNAKLGLLGSRENDLDEALQFSFRAMRDEMCVGGVYIRIYNKVEDDEDIDDPSQLCRDLIDYVWAYSKPEDDEEGPRTEPPQSTVTWQWRPSKTLLYIMIT